jgi:hypothetical protein
MKILIGDTFLNAEVSSVTKREDDDRTELLHG